MAKKLNARPIISEGIPGVMNLKMIHAADPEIIALKAAGVFALGHHIPAVNGINSPTNRILKESRSRVYTSPMYKATNMEKIAKTGINAIIIGSLLETKNYKTILPKITKAIKS